VGRCQVLPRAPPGEVSRSGAQSSIAGKENVIDKREKTSSCVALGPGTCLEKSFLIWTAAHPLIDSDSPRMPPASKKSMSYARCFLTASRLTRGSLEGLDQSLDLRLLEVLVMIAAETAEDWDPTSTSRPVGHHHVVRLARKKAEKELLPSSEGSTGQLRDGADGCKPAGAGGVCDFTKGSAFGFHLEPSSRQVSVAQELGGKGSLPGSTASATRRGPAPDWIRSWSRPATGEPRSTIEAGDDL
jgi:hypothetical protein